MGMQVCKICGQRNEKTVVFKAREMMYGMRNEFDYFQCDHCECLQICEFPNNISDYYPSNYYSFSPYKGMSFKGFTGYINRAKYKASVFRQTLFQKLLYRILPVSKFDFFQGLNINSESRILEVGCGNGNRLLYPLAELEFKNILGCDPFISSSMKYSNGLEILKNDVFSLNGEWDIIIYDHAFEHIDNPQENLRKVSELLKPGGVCVLRIPTVPCYAWSHYNINWVQLDAPRHYFIHSPKSIDVLALRSGLKLTNVQYDSTHFQFTGSEKYVTNVSLVTKREKGFNAFVKRKLKKFKYIKLAEKLNREGNGDQAIFYLQKI